MPTVKMNADDYELYKAVLIKLSGSVLPRLNEVSGEDGEPIKPTKNKPNAPYSSGNAGGILHDPQIMASMDFTTSPTALIQEICASTKH